MIEKQAFTVDEFMERHGIRDKHFVYDEMGAGRLPSYKMGRRRMVSRAAADAWQVAMEKRGDEPLKVWPAKKKA
jgi:hypothetical protein